MVDTTFLAGAIQDQHRDFYIERKCDYEVVKNLRLGNYVTLLEPRQQGKTSLIHALRRRSDFYNTLFLYVDVSTLNRDTTAEWYASLFKRLDAQIPGLPSPLSGDRSRLNSNDWRVYLSGLSWAARDCNQPVVIAVDEIAAAQFDGSNGFFAVMRDVFNSREAEPQFHHLSFLLSGTASTQDLVPDLRVSPFNISKRIRLDDFTLENIYQAGINHHLPRDILEEAAKAVAFIVGGQPYLSQLFLMELSAPENIAKLEKGDVRTVVDLIALRLMSMDYNHLRSLRSRMDELVNRTDWDYLEEIKGILAGEGALFYPTMIAWQEQLELAGVIRQGEDGRCQIRCPLYQTALAVWLQTKQASKPAPRPSIIGDLINSKIDNFVDRLRETSLLISDYDKQIRKGTMPREKAGLRDEISALETALVGYSQEYETYRATPQAGIREDFSNAEHVLKILKDDIQRLKKGVEA
jgi:hypothetical protein